MSHRHSLPRVLFLLPNLQESWKDLPALLSWFRDGLAADEAAELSFSPKLNKQQRALVHRWAGRGQGAGPAGSNGSMEWRSWPVARSRGVVGGWRRQNVLQAAAAGPPC